MNDNQGCIIAVNMAIKWYSWENQLGESIDDMIEDMVDIGHILHHDVAW